MTSKVDIFSGASVAVGAGPVIDVNEDTTQAIALRARYDEVVETALTSHRWGFARRKKTLSKLTDPPLNEYSAAFQIPAEALAIFRVRPDVKYSIQGREILTNAGSMDSDYIARVSEGDFPGYFVNALVSELAAQIAIPVTRDADIAEYYKSAALFAWRTARSIVSMQRPTEAADDHPFIWARSA